ncbi:DUF565 domain-containing protein [Vulcanococcus sp. Clear-D1]|uniref:DUF565 domain-containing protein n=1 Tax=Vulcanococcus sp. Clear-D1 TaxID=2766970 RepID=UPI0019BCD037|nr:DUF565 domain-containing protein [Vulcanococcus sp. Clear-D1]MBD1192699.1 DUF565 domain-containing protein [Vulcanococcus sp. Clear-D1]
MSSSRPLQRTRLQQSLGGAWPRLEQWARNPWRRLSLLLIVLLSTFFIGNAVSTLIGARAFLDPPAALICVVLIEVAVRARKPLLRLPGDRLGLQLLDMTRIGFCYGLLLEGFKLL